MKNNDDIRFLRESVKDGITLPESLSKENITFLVAEEKVHKKKKGKVRRFVAAGVAACIMITCAVVLSEHGFSAPEAVIEDKNEVAQNVAENKKILSHEEIIKEIKAYAKEYSEQEVYLYNTDNKVFFSSSAGGVEGSVDTNINGDMSVSESFGEVNLREEGVYEADIFITDGEYLYCVDSYYKIIRIVKAQKDGTLNETARIDSSDDNSFNYRGLYIYKNYLIAGFAEYREEDSVLKERSGVVIYDISDKESPEYVKEIALDGNYVSSRITNGKLILISNYSLVRYFNNCDDSLLIPTVYFGDENKAVPAEDITYLESEEPESYVNIATQTLDDIDASPVTSSFLGNSYDTYCTEETLYTISIDYGFDSKHLGFGAIMMVGENVKTKITAIDISGDTAEYKGNTEVGGSILNDYSIDYFDGYLRLAVNKGEENCIYVLDKNLDMVGNISGIATGEQIKSARFMGKYAYVVTFRQTDPLFVIDLSDPKNPEIKGEVKLPGFSSYLHPAGDGLLVGIGYGGTETGVDGSSKISLFDVSDPASPKEIDSLVFPESSLGTHPKTFCSVSQDSFLVTYEKWTDGFIDTEEYRGHRVYTGALYIRVQNGKLVLENSYLAHSTETACRSTFIEDRVYIFGIASGIASFNMKTGELLSTVGSMKELFTFTPITETAEEILFEKIQF